MVFDGIDTQAFSMAARRSFAAGGAGDWNLYDAGLLGSAGDIVAFLGALPGAPGFSRHAAASPADHGFSGGCHGLAGYCLPRVAIWRTSHCKIKEFLSSCAVDHARGTDHRWRLADYFAGGDSRITG